MKARRTTRRYLVGGAVIGAGLLAVGCGQSSKGGRPLAGPGSASAPTAAGVGSGSAMGGLFGGAMVSGPQVAITSPARGSYVQGARITVEGTAMDLGKGVAAVKVAGMTASVDESGRFSADIPLEAGLNTIVVEATDEQGGRTEKHVSVIAGETASEDTLLPGAAAMRITDGALDMIEPAITAGIEAQRATIKQQVMQTRVPDLKLTGFDFGRVQSSVDCTSGGLSFKAEIADVVLGIEAEAKFLLIFTKKLKGDVRASKLTIEGTVMVGVQNGQATIQVGQVGARADGFSVPDWARDKQGQIQQGFQQAFAAAAAQNLSTSLQQAFGAGAVRGMTNQAVMGKDLKIEYALESLQFDADGATASLGANVSAVQPEYGDQAPGSVVVRGALPRLLGGASGGQNVALAVHQDAINRALHAAWRAGALKMDLNQAAMDQLLPGVPTALNTTALMMAVPQLAGVLVPDLPIELKIESMLPPVVTLPSQGQAQLELCLGELVVKMDVIHPTAGAVTLVEASFASRMPAVLVERGGKVTLQPAGQPSLHVDVIGETMPGTEGMLEAMTAQAAGPALQGSLSQIQGVALPAVKGYTLGNLTFQKVEKSLVVLGQAIPAVKP